MMRDPRVWCVMGVVAAGVLAGGPAAAQTTPALPETVTVTVDGASAAPGLIAKDEAIRDALRNAVEQAAGVFINAQSETQNYQLVRDVILSRARGFVKSYQIIKQGLDADVVYRVTVKAVVVAKQVGDTWLEVRGLLVEKGMPRMMVNIVETVDGAGTGRNTTQARFENILLRYGIPQVSQQQVKDNDRRDLSAAQLADDFNKIAAISGRYKADVVILGKSRATLTQSKPIYGVLTHLYNADVELRGMRTANAKLIYSDSLSATEGNRNKIEAARQALDLAGAGVASKFLVRVMDTWIKELSKPIGTDYDVEISGIKFLQLAGLRKDLMANPKIVTTCNIKDYRNQVAFLVVGSTSSTANLAVLMSTVKSVTLEVTDVTANSIKAKVVVDDD